MGGRVTGRHSTIMGEPAPLPKCKTLALERRGWTLRVTLNQPDSRNALSAEMIGELDAVFNSIVDDKTLRAVVLRGSGGHFSAGGDLRRFAEAGKEKPKTIQGSPHYLGAERLSRLLERIDASPAVTVGVFEGATLGAAFGFLCVVDVAIALDNAQFGITGNMYGVPPGPIVPFLVERFGLSLARRMALTGIKLGARDAFALGLIHGLALDPESLEKRLNQMLADIRRCAPGANRITKELLMQSRQAPRDQLYSLGANAFARALHGLEVKEGTAAFFEKRPPRWSEE